MNVRIDQGKNPWCKKGMEFVGSHLGRIKGKKGT